MGGVVDIFQTVVDQVNAPKLLNLGKTSENRAFALAGNLLNFAGWGGTGGLLPNSGLTENRHGYEWEMGCVSWGGGAEQNQYKSIKFRCNPSQVQWTMRQRSEEQKTKAGTVLHVWNDSNRNTYYDEPVITMQLQAGNILPVRNILATDEPEVPEGLNNFYEFLSLVDEVKVLPDGTANLCYIEYNSLVFPRMKLWGFFTPEGVSFSDRADNHATVNDWTASFTVYKTEFGQLGRNASDQLSATLGGALAGESLKSRFRREGYPYSNKKSENFGLFQDAATTIGAALDGQIPIRDLGKAGQALVNSASQRTVSRVANSVAAAGASVLTSGAPKIPKFF